MSVYIPDELLEQAKRLEDSDNTSRLVQRGLERLVEEQTRMPSYAQTPARSFERIIELRERLLAEARKDYERGYTIAIEAASRISLHAINALVDANFDLKRWLDPFKRGAQCDLLQNSEEIEAPSEAELLDSVRTPAPSDEQFREGDWWWLWKTAEALGSFADPIGTDHYSFTPTNARQRGYTDAMRELWSALENPGSSSADLLHQIGELREEYQRKQAAEGETNEMSEDDESKTP